MRKCTLAPGGGISPQSPHCAPSSSISTPLGGTTASAQWHSRFITLCSSSLGRLACLVLKPMAHSCVLRQWHTMEPVFPTLLELDPHLLPHWRFPAAPPDEPTVPDPTAFHSRLSLFPAQPKAPPLDLTCKRNLTSHQRDLTCH